MIDIDKIRAEFARSNRWDPNLRVDGEQLLAKLNQLERILRRSSYAWTQIEGIYHGPTELAVGRDAERWSTMMSFALCEILSAAEMLRLRLLNGRTVAEFEGGAR